ncbi:MAG TPA: DUF4383 domain-containing protein [Burkholderiales bacterium]|nr:DUF4383 domain-containing protein [Burkholderiales bacterium]
MTARTLAALCGALYLALGVAGFVPPLWERPPSSPPIAVRVFYATLFNVLHVNIILSMMHLTLGLWAAMSANDKYSSVVFARAATIVFLLMGVAGLIPVREVQTLFGTTPLFGYNAWLYLGTALVTLIFAIRPGYELTQIGLKEQLNPHIPNK